MQQTMTPAQKRERKRGYQAARRKKARNKAALWSSDCYFARIGQPGRTSLLDPTMQTLASATRAAEGEDRDALKKPTANKSAKATYKF